jgi:hypothetical protein
VVQEISLFKQLPQAEQYVGTILPQEEHLETGNFTTNITNTTTFYAEAGACESTRRAVVATVNPLPALPLIAVSYKPSFILSK